ncbi:tetratricopeptide repeat protein [Erythrobacter sp. MTPC3]|uniref:tetratricopeptide repeat protein n=1 Tax=Erythrobacter sp. MTPC3 TaxID=3056564 RepID=UPI0036F19997
MSLFLALLLQVGPNPALDNSLGLPDELANRPPRENAVEESADPVSQWLAGCLAQLAEDPARAHSQAQIRLPEVSGPDRVMTNHCLGLAATELGLWQDARQAFIAARDETPPEELRARARFSLMAGNAALGSGDGEGALLLLQTAQRDANAAAAATLEAIAAMDVARALVALDRPGEAFVPLSRATLLEPEKAEAWLLTATLYRRLDRLDDAQQAIEQAAKLAPMAGDIGLEAGVIAVLSGREEAARQSWGSVIETQPESPAAITAQSYLDQLGPAPAPAKPAGSGS